MNQEQQPRGQEVKKRASVTKMGYIGKSSWGKGTPPRPELEKFRMGAGNANQEDLVTGSG